MAARPRPVYVQIDIRAPIERVWAATQAPDLHQRWDLRFSTIEYLPRPDEREPQRFRYATRIGLGLRIEGEGESVGAHDAPGGARSSALRFWSGDAKSLVREGSGYWKYVPLADAPGEGPVVRFLTRYDYGVRFGAAGRWVDRLIFRPLIGWATAWSFDRLRLWLERGIEPAAAARAAVSYAVARVALAVVWAYQGLVPKLLVRHADELTMLRQEGLPAGAADAVRAGLGVAEVAVAVVLLVAWRARWPLWATAVLMPLALIGVAARSPAFLGAAFNPVGLNVAVMGLAVVGLLADTESLPSAARCARRPAAGAGGGA